MPCNYLNLAGLRCVTSTVVRKGRDVIAKREEEGMGGKRQQQQQQQHLHTINDRDMGPTRAGRSGGSTSTAGG